MPLKTYTHDVLVIGAGGAGLRAAIEASAMGLKTAIVSKSLLGKAHTVMAEGGAAAAMGNVDPADGWQTHFHDTLHGGKFLNDWRMAKIHATEAPDRIRELELWGAVFDRTAEGENGPASFDRLPSPMPRGRPHRPRDDSHPARQRRTLGH